MTDHCRHCEHPESDHPNHFFCMVDDCRCPGWVKAVAWDK